jgi:hypothetical protein
MHSEINTAFVGDSLKHEPVDSTALCSKTAHLVVHFLFEAFLETADFLLQGADVSSEERYGGRRHHRWSLGPLATSCPEEKGGQRSEVVIVLPLLLFLSSLPLHLTTVMKYIHGCNGRDESYSYSLS